MRLIGHITSETGARTFGDFLYGQGIENQVEPEAASSWGVWIHDEDKIGTATEFLGAFLKDPGDPKYRTAAKAAAGRRAEEAKSERAYRNKVRDVRTMFTPLTERGFGPVTLVLMLISIGVALYSNFGADRLSMKALYISLQFEGLPEVRQGQVWRLITPIFMHFGLLHILFNMLWLRDLGGMIESRLGSKFLLIQVFALSIVSNLGQYYYDGPLFGGMSGVVYGLLGYVWMRGKFDPTSGLFLHPVTVVMMVIWFFLGFTGVLGPIANIAHAAGFGMGLAWGYGAGQRR